MKVTEIYHRWVGHTLRIGFIRSNGIDYKIREYIKPTKASTNRYIVLLNSKNVIYYSASNMQYITANALKAGV